MRKQYFYITFNIGGLLTYSKKSMTILQSFVSINSTILLNLANCVLQYSISAIGPTNSPSRLSCLYWTKH